MINSSDANSMSGRKKGRKTIELQQSFKHYVDNRLTKSKKNDKERYSQFTSC